MPAKEAGPTDRTTKDMIAAKTILGAIGASLHDIEASLKDLAKLVRPERPASELAHLYGVIKDIRDATCEVFEPLFTKVEGGKMYEYVRKEVIPKAFERENLTSFTTKDGYRVTVSTNYYASIRGDRREDAYKWLADNGLGDIIQPVVNASTLSAALKKRLEDEGKEPPEEIFNAAFIDNTSMTRTKK